MKRVSDVVREWKARIFLKFLEICEEETFIWCFDEFFFSSPLTTKTSHKNQGKRLV